MSFTCVAHGFTLGRLPAEHRSRVLTGDSTGALYARSHNWSIPLADVPARRDSIARSLSTRGMMHKACADAVDRSSAAHPIWLSTWTGPTYGAVLFHRIDDDHAQLTISVARGESRPCGLGPAA